MPKLISILGPILLGNEALGTEPLLLGDLEAAKSYDFCDWAHNHAADASLLPEVSAYLGSEASKLDLQNQPSAVVIDAGMRVAKASVDRDSCEETIAKGHIMIASIRKRNAKAFRKQARFKKSKDDDIATAQAEITALWKEDQIARVAYVQTKSDSKTNARHWAHRLATADAVAIDQKSAIYLQEILTRYDWIDIARFTRPISQHAWILVQHSDDDVELQKLVLGRMEAYLATGGVLKRNYAYLWDRIAVNTDQMQRYGTQPDWSSCKAGILTLMPMEDPDNIDIRREKMRMGPVQNDLLQMSRQTCPQPTQH